MVRRLRIAATAAGALTCAAFIVLWMRSQRCTDTVYYVPQDGAHIYRIDTYPGRAFVGRSGYDFHFAEPAFTIHGGPHDLDDHLQPPAGFLGLVLVDRPAYRGAYLPYWLVASATAVAAAALWPIRLTRFSLKRLLLFTTLIAIVTCAGVSAANFTAAYDWRLDVAKPSWLIEAQQRAKARQAAREAADRAAS